MTTDLPRAASTDMGTVELGLDGTHAPRDTMMSMISDGELLHAWRRGDEAKGEALCERYYDRVARFFVNKLGDQTEDLVQKTFLALLEGRDRIEDGSRFRAYVFGIAFNVLRARLRERYRVSEEVLSHSLHDMAPGAETLMGRSEQEHVLQRALRRLRLEHQVALELMYWEGLNGSEISRVIDRPESTIRTHLIKARAQLEAILGTMDADPELVQSTVSDLDVWAERLRDAVYGDHGKAS